MSGIAGLRDLVIVHAVVLFAAVGARALPNRRLGRSVLVATQLLGAVAAAHGRPFAVGLIYLAMLTALGHLVWPPDRFGDRFFTAVGRSYPDRHILPPF